MKKIQSSYDYDDLIISGEKSLFGPGNAKLPLPPMLMLDRIHIWMMMAANMAKVR
jgi:3-hydroxyacyl-[acyl-carrier protein] dehydratase/trans-2-decenoyl-[acyl-carrier protein] isomerase